MTKILQDIEREVEEARDLVKQCGAEKMCNKLYAAGYEISVRGLQSFQYGHTKKSSYPTVRAIQLLSELKKI